MRRSQWLAVPMAAHLLLAGPADRFPTGALPMENYYGDPPTIYTITNSDTGKETAVAITFPSYSTNMLVTYPTGFTFLRQTAGTGPVKRSSKASPRGGGPFPPDPDEFQFDPWDTPDDPPFPDDFPDPPDLPDIPLPDPTEDPWDDLPQPPPFPDDELDMTDLSPGTLDVTKASSGSAAKAQPALAPRAATISLLGMIQVGPSASGIVKSPDKSTMYVAVMGNGTIAVIDRASRTLKSRITLPAGAQPYALAMTPDGTRLYAGEFSPGSAAVYSIDLPAGTVKKLSVPGSYISQAIVTPDGTQLWVCSYFGNVQIYDVLTNAYIGAIQISNPWNVAFNASGTLAYVTNGGISVPGFVTVYNTSTLQQVANIGVGNTPRAIRITPSGRHAFVANYYSDFVSQIDMTTNTVIRTIKIGDTGASGIGLAHN